MSVIQNMRKSLAQFIFPNQVKTSTNGYFAMLNGYSPVFDSWEGGIYETLLTRSCVHSFATHFSKFEIRIEGGTERKNSLEKILNTKPNAIHNTSQFLYHVATLLKVHNSVVIFPVEDDYGRIMGYYPMSPSGVEIRQKAGQLYLIKRFDNGDAIAIEYERCGIVTQMMLDNVFFGEDNSPLNGTLELIESQNQKVKEGLKTGNRIRFIGELAHTAHDKTIESARKQFVEENFNQDSGGLLLFDQKYKSVQQVKNDKWWVVDAEQQELIQQNCYTYFGTNAAILQNKFNNTEWTAYYEGNIEPLAIQLARALTNMTFTKNERSFGNKIVLVADQSQYQTPEQKLDRFTKMFDRGAMTFNEGRTMFNMPLIDESWADTHYIRAEYVKIDYGEADKTPLSKPGPVPLSGETEPTAGEPNGGTDDESTE